jgi:hypothetical protein
MKLEQKAKLDNMDIKIQSLYFTAEQNMILKNMFSKHNFMVSKKSFTFNKPEYEGLVYNLSLDLNLFENVLDLKSNYQDISIILINKDNPSGLNKFKKILNEEENFAKKVILFGTSNEEDWQYASYIKVPFEESNLLNTIYNAYLLYYKINFKGYENNLLFYESDTKFINIFKKAETYPVKNITNKDDIKTQESHNLNSQDTQTHLNPHIENFLLEKDSNMSNANNASTNNTINNLNNVAISASANIKEKDLKNSVNIELNLSQFKTTLDDLNIPHLPQEEFKIDLSSLTHLNPSDLLEDSNEDVNNNIEHEKLNTDSSNSNSNTNNTNALLEFDFEKLHAMSNNLNAFNLNTMNNPEKETDKEKNLSGGMGMSSLDVDLKALSKITEEVNLKKDEIIENESDIIDEFGHFNEKDYENNINNFTQNLVNTDVNTNNAVPTNINSEKIYSDVENNTTIDSNINNNNDETNSGGLNFDIPLITNFDTDEEDKEINHKAFVSSLSLPNKDKKSESGATVLPLQSLEFNESLHNQLNLLDDGLEKAYYDKDDIRDDKELNQKAIEEIHEQVKEGDEEYEQFLQDNPELLKEEEVASNNVDDLKLEEFNDLMVERKKLSSLQQNQVGKLTQREIDLLDEELKAYNINKLTILNQISQVRQLQLQLAKTHHNETCAEIIFDDPYEQEKHIFFINFETLELYTNFELKLTNSYTQTITNYVETSVCHQYLTERLKVNTLKNKIYYLNNLAVSHQTFDQYAWSEARENFSEQGFYRNNLLTFIMALTYELDPNPRLSQEIDIHQRYNLNLTPLLKNLYAKDINILKWAIGMYQKSFMLSALQSIDELGMTLNEKEFVQFINTAYLLGFLEEVSSKNKENKGLFNKIKKIF